MISKTIAAAAALGLTCLGIAGCVDEGGRYSSEDYVDRNGSRNFGFDTREYRGRGHASQRDGIGRTRRNTLISAEINPVIFDECFRPDSLLSFLHRRSQPYCLFKTVRQFLASATTVAQLP
jgi:hypothetical protein